MQAWSIVEAGQHRYLASYVCNRCVRTKFARPSPQFLQLVTWNILEPKKCWLIVKTHRTSHHAIRDAPYDYEIRPGHDKMADLKKLVMAKLQASAYPEDANAKYTGKSKT